MEDLKKIQEFFSKSLNEISKEDAWKKFQKEKSVTDKTIKVARKDFEKEWEAGNLKENVDKKYSNFLVALRDSGVTNMFGAAPYLQSEFGLDKREAREVLANWMRSFGESLKENSRKSPDFILTEPAEIKYTESFGTGIKAPGVLHHANEGVFLGAEGAYIIVLPGGTFYVDEDKEEAMPIWPLKDQDQALHMALDYTPFSPKFETWKNWIKRPNVLDENALGFNDSRLSSDQHRDLDYAVRGDSAYTFGNDPYADDQLRYKYAVKMGFLNEAKKLTYNDFVQMVRDDMNAGSSSDESVSDERVKKEAKRKYNEYLQGASVDDLFEVKVEVDDETEFKLDLKHLLDKHVVEQGYSLTKEHETDPNLELKVGDYQTQHFHMCPGAKSLYQDIENKVEDMGLAIRSAKLQDALFAMEESALKNGANEADVFAAETIADQIMAMASMMGLDKEHSYIQGHVDKIKGAVDKEQVAEGASTEEKRMAMQAIKRFAKYRGVSEKEAKADLLRAVKELGSIEEAINEIVETIQAGKVLEEKLCKKGEAYRKRRMAAGEKSSAYLSGRAVKVCKGQISGRKKRKKRKSKK